jgi:hypothetical protein
VTPFRPARPRRRPLAALAVALVPLLVGGILAPAAWADEAPTEPAPVELATETDLVEEPVADPVPAHEDAAPKEAPDAEPTPATGVVKASTGVLEPGTSVVVNRTLTGATALRVAVIGASGQKRVEIVTPSGATVATNSFETAFHHVLEPGTPLANGSYRILIHNLSDVAMAVHYEITWHGAALDVAAMPPRPQTGLLAALEVLLDGEPLPEGATGVARAQRADGSLLGGALQRDEENPERWTAYLGAVTGPVVLHARFLVDDVAYEYTWASRGESLDITAPVVSSLTTPAASNSRGWFARPVTVHASATDAGSGMGLIEWMLDGGPVVRAVGGRVDIPLDHGEHSLMIRGVDRAGNTSSWISRTLNVDTVAPTVAALAPADGAGYRLGEHVTVDYDCDDDLSGRLDCVGTMSDGAVLPTRAEGEFEFAITATDRAGNITRSTVTYRVVDPGLPVVDLTLPAPDGADDWHLAFPALRLETDPGSRLRWTDTVDGVTVDGSADSATATFTPEREGLHLFRYWAVDSLGRTGEPITVEFKVDATAPRALVRMPARVQQGTPLTADFECGDDVSRIASCVGSTDVGQRLPTAALGRHELTVTATDNAGHRTVRVVTYEVVAGGAVRGLAATGADSVAWIAGAALALLAIGGLATVVRRRTATEN